VVLVEAAEATKAAEEDESSSLDDDADDDDARRSAACSRASLARARLGRRCRRRRRWGWRCRRWLRLRRRADEDAETEAERDRRDGTEAEAEAEVVERERHRGFRCFDRFVGGVRRLLVVCLFAFRAAGLAGGLTGRGGGGAVDRLWSVRVPEAEADVDDADEPRLGPADMDASSSALDSDVPEESERVIAGVRCVWVAWACRGARVGSLA
jgi:hypothetical protein